MRYQKHKPKKKNNKLHFIKIKITIVDMINEIKMQTIKQERKKIHTYDKTLVAKIYKEILQLSESNTIFKNQQNLKTFLKIYEMSIIIEKMFNIISWKSKIEHQLESKVKLQR